MSEIRDAKLLIRKKLTTGGNIPSDALIGEPFVNLYDGILYHYCERWIIIFLLYW